MFTVSLDLEYHWIKDARDALLPLQAQTKTVRKPIEPIAFDCVKVIVVRDGSALLVGDFGQHSVKLGDVILLGPHTLCGGQPQGQFTTTTVYADMDYLIDQVFWKNVSFLHDRFDAQHLVATTYTESAQILRIGEEVSALLFPWLDQLVALTAEYQPTSFYRVQSLWFLIADVLAPFVKTSPVRVGINRRSTMMPSLPRNRRFVPLRYEAYKAAELMRSEPGWRWSIEELASKVHLSKSQLGRVFVEAFGKTPIAYLTMLRTERMAILLRTSTAPIRVIAALVGWDDPDFAAQQFRRRIGVTPSEYRRIGRKVLPSEYPE